MLFYIFLFCFIFILSNIEDRIQSKNKKVIIILMIMTLACVSGFRYLGGSDLELYEYGYDKVPSLFTADFYSSIGTSDFFFWEPGFLFLISFCKYVIGLSFYGFLIVDAAIFYTFLYIGYKRYSLHWGILLMFFMYKLFFYETFVAMRQQISICLFFLIMHLIEDRKPLKYYLLCTFVILPFHYGSIALFFAYFINKIKISKDIFFRLGIFLLPFAILPPVFSTFIQPVMTFLPSDKGVEYFAGGETQSIFYTLETYMIWFLIYVHFNRLKYACVHADFMIRLFMILIPCVTVFRDVIILRRVMDYFYLSIPILVGYICTINRNNSKLIFIGYVSVCFYGYLRYLNNFDEGSLVPYVSWLQLPGASFFLK